MPVLRSLRRVQFSSTPWPRGDTSPIPVTTTSLSDILILAAGQHPEKLFLLLDILQLRQRDSVARKFRNHLSLAIDRAHAFESRDSCGISALELHPQLNRIPGKGKAIEHAALDLVQQEPVLEVGRSRLKPSRQLGERFQQQDPRHDGIFGKMIIEKIFAHGDVFHAIHVLPRLPLQNFIDQKISHYPSPLLVLEPRVGRSLSWTATTLAAAKPQDSRTAILQLEIPIL